MKKISAIILILAAILLFPAASRSFSLQPAGTQTEGPWILFYTGTPADKEGVVDTAKIDVPYTNSYTGTIPKSLAKKIQNELGYHFGESPDAWFAAKTSAPLQKGEYIKAFYRKNYEITEVYLNDASGSTKIATAKKALLPQIKLVYSSQQNAALQAR